MSDGIENITPAKTRTDCERLEQINQMTAKLIEVKTQTEDVDRLRKLLVASMTKNLRLEADAAELRETKDIEIAHLKSVYESAIDCYLEAQAKIKKMRIALAPFAAAKALADESAKRREEFGMGKQSDKSSPGWGITYGDLKRAWAAFK